MRSYGTNSEVRTEEEGPISPSIQQESENASPIHSPIEPAETPTHFHQLLTHLPNFKVCTLISMACIVGGYTAMLWYVAANTPASDAAKIRLDQSSCPSSKSHCRTEIDCRTIYDNTTAITDFLRHIDLPRSEIWQLCGKFFDTQCKPLNSIHKFFSTPSQSISNSNNLASLACSFTQLAVFLFPAGTTFATFLFMFIAGLAILSTFPTPNRVNHPANPETQAPLIPEMLLTGPGLA